MFRSSVATESSGERASAQDTLRSTNSNLVPANRNDSSSSGQVNEADTATGRSIPTVISPTVTPPFPPPASLIGGPPAHPTYETHRRTDEPPKNKAQSLSDGRDTSQLPQLSPLMPVRPLSESQPNIQAQSTMIYPHVSQDTFIYAAIPTSWIIPQELPSQYSQGSYRVLTAQTPPSRADGDILASFSGSPRMPHQNLTSNPQILPSPIHQQNVPPLRQSADTPSMHYGIPSQPKRPQSAVAHQLYPSSSARPIVPRSAPPQFYNLPNAPISQAQPIHVGSPQGFIPRRFFPHSASPHSYSLPSAPTPQTHSTHAGTSQQFVPQPTPPQFYNLPNAPTPQAQPIHVETPQRYFPHSALPHSYSLSSAFTPQTHSFHAGTPQHFVPQSAHQLYNIPNASTPQAQSTHQRLPQGFVPQQTSPYFYSLPRPTPQARSFHVGPPHPFILQTPASNFGHIPSPQPFSNVAYPPAVRRVDSFIAHDPFQVFRGNDKVDGVSDISTFDDIPTPGSTPRLKSQGGENSPYGSLRSRPPSGEIPPLSLEAYPYNPASNVPAPQTSSSQPSRVPEPPNQQQMPYISRRDDASEKDDTLISHYDHPAVPKTPSSSLSSVSEQLAQSQTSVFPDLHMPPTQLSLIIESKSDGTLSNSLESQTGTDESSSRPYIPPYPQHSRYELPESIFSRLTRFFQRSYHTQSPGSPQPSTATDPPITPNTNWDGQKLMKFAIKFVWVTLPMQMYLYLLLRLPALYFSRVAQIFEEARMALADIKKMALELPSQGPPYDYQRQMAYEPSSVSPAYKRLASTWEFFIDSLMREWKTFNIISVLLLTAILTILQIQGAAEDPLTKYTALFSLMCALISLLFGCSYIIRFGSMRKPYKAAEWALEALKTKTLIWWNVWVLLAMPAIWLTWSILLYIACIMAFVWRSAVTDTTTREISDTGLLAVRIVITVVLIIGMIYAFLIMTTFRRYGSAMDQKWKRRIDNWIKKKARKQGSFVQPTLGNPLHPPMPYVYPDGSTIYHVPTYNSSPYYQPSFGDTQTRYAWDTYGPAYSSDTYAPPPQPRWTFTGSPNSPSYSDVPDDHLWDAYTPAPSPDSHLPPTEAHLTPPAWSPDDVTRANTTFNAGYIPSPQTTPPPLPPTVSITPPEGPPASLLVPEDPHLVAWAARKKPQFAVPPPSLPPISGTPIDPSSNNNKVTGSPPESRNKVGGDDDVPDNKNRVRFRSPLTSDPPGSVNLANRDMDKKIKGTPRASSDIGS